MDCLDGAFPGEVQKRLDRVFPHAAYKACVWPLSPLQPASCEGINACKGNPAIFPYL